MKRTPLLVLHAVAAAAVSIVTGWAGSGIVLCVVPAAFLVRYIWLDGEQLMVGAMSFTALVAMMANTPHGLAGTMTVSIGGFVAAEIASHAARLRRALPLRGAPGDLAATVAVVGGSIATAIAAALLVHVDVPATIAVAAAAVMAVAVMIAVARRPPRALDQFE